MEQAILLSKIFGPVLTLLGLFVLFRPDEVLKMWNSVKANPALLYLGAAIHLLLGFTILALYNEWTMHLPFFVTLLGYVLAIRGIIVLFWADTMMQFGDKVVEKPTLRGTGIIPLIWGLLLLWLGYI
jgi:hypothetical protein